MEELLGRSGIKQRFLRRTFENFVTDTPERKRSYEIARAYADDFERHSVEGSGLYIEGTFGTGKTHLAAAIALYLIEQERRVIFKTADDLFRDIKETFDKDDGSEQKILARYKECDLLIVDDLGSGSSRIAAWQAGYNFLGTEIDADYFKAQEERYASYAAQYKLF